MSRLQVRVHDSLHTQIEEQAARLGLSLSEYVVLAISDRLRRDAESANQIALPAQSREWFFRVLEDTSALPDRWEHAARVAEAIEG